MSAGFEQRFDPRFDPAFQPGFDGSAPGPVSEKVPALVPARVPGPAPGTGSGQTPEKMPGTGSGQTPVKMPEPGPSEAPSQVPVQLPGKEQEGGRMSQYDVVAAVAPSGINPYLRGLWIISGSLVLGGIALLTYLPQLTSTVRETAGPEAYFFLVQAMLMLVPLLLTLGISIAVVLLFLRAIEWRRRAAVVPDRR